MSDHAPRLVRQSRRSKALKSCLDYATVDGALSGKDPRHAEAVSPPEGRTESGLMYEADPPRNLERSRRLDALIFAMSTGCWRSSRMGPLRQRLK